MRFQCASCGGKEDEALHGLELGPDGSSDERWLGLLRCKSCHARYLYSYEESRRGRLDGESVSTELSPLGVDSADRLETVLRSCSQPRSGSCQCAAHRAVRSREHLKRILDGA